MKGDTGRADLAHRLSDMCLKILLSAIAFSALAFALAERIKEAPQFEAFANFVLSGQKLSEQLADLAEEPCWQLYSTALSDPAAIKRTTLREISQIQCSSQVPNAVRVGIKSIPVASSSNPAPPAASPNSQSELWLPLPEAEPIASNVRALWNDSMLEQARRYSVAAADEIDRWRSHRTQLFNRRIGASGLFHASRPQPESTFDVTNLQFADLEQIKKASHTSVTDIDAALRDQFRAPFPETSFGVNLGVASQIVAFILTTLHLTLMSYVRAAIIANARSTLGTVFQVLLASTWGELVICVGLSIPLAAVVYLDYSIHVRGTAGFYFTACAIAMFAMILSIIDRLLAPRKQKHSPPSRLASAIKSRTKAFFSALH